MLLQLWKVYKRKLKVRSDHRSEFSNLCNWKLEAWKKFRLQRDSNPWPPRYRCDALPTELWSHSLGARSIVGSHFPVRGVKRCKVYEIIHIWTADIDESEKWSSQWIFQFMQLEIGSLKKIQASTGFEPVTSALPVRCSTNWAMKPLIGSKVNCRFPFSRERSETM